MGGDGAVPATYPRVRRLDYEVLVGRVRAAAMAETVVAGRETDRRVGEDVAGIRAGKTRQQDRVDPAALQHREHRLDDRRIGGRGRRVVAAARIHFDVAESALGEVCP